MENTFVIIDVDDHTVRAISKNFPECVGEGKNQVEAIEAMSQKIIYIMNNKPNRIKAVVAKQVNECYAAGDYPLGVYHGGNVFKRSF